jgi:quercetin dioxygenase-like cupin family protein
MGVEKPTVATQEGSMKLWNLADREVEPHKPQVLATTEEGRAVLIDLTAGDSLPEHHVRERAIVLVVSGQLEIEDAEGEKRKCGAGTMAVFEPLESHSVNALEDSRFLLLLAPWSLEEHSSLEPWRRSASSA